MALARKRDRSGRPLSIGQNRIILGFLLLAMLCGGAGSYYPLLQLLLEIAAVWLILHVVRTYSLPASDPAFRSFIALFGAITLILLVQLIPLPPSVWQNLPAHHTAATIFRLLNWSDRWHALSITPDLTLRMLLTLLPALAAFLAAACGGLKSRLILFRIIVMVALASTFLASVQVATGQDAFMLYNTAHSGAGVGFFVNRNHQAAFLLIAMFLCPVPGVLPTGKRSGKSALPDGLPMTIAAIAFLGLGVLATTSRTALAILPLALLAAIAMTVHMGNARRWVAGCALVYLVAGIALYPTQLVQRPLARMATASEDLRQQYWDNSAYLVRESFPWGTGFGSFDMVYRTVEPLDQVTPLLVNNAHNDYLELALEGGLPAMILAAVGLLATIAFLIRAYRMANGRQVRMQCLAASGGIAVILLFSVVDYPLRMTALSVLTAILLACTVQDRGRSAPPIRPKWTRPLLWGMAGVIGLLALGNGLSTAFVLRRMPEPAVALAPWSSAAWTLAANQAQIAEDRATARAAGLRAISIAPINVGALRAVASAELASGKNDSGWRLFEVAAALGWRDRLTQLWLIDRGMAGGNLPLAAQRIDGLLRQGVMGDVLLAQMRAIFLAPGGERIVADRLADRPPWRQGFLNVIADDSANAAPKILWLIRAMRKAGDPVTPDTTALLRWRLSEAGHAAAARAIWMASGGKGLIGNGGFEATGQSPAPGAAPYVWRAPTLAGVRAVVAEDGADGSRQSLLIASDGYAGGVALAQTLLLEQGRYRLRASFRNQAMPAGQPVFALACGDDMTQVQGSVGPVLRGMEWNRIALSVTVPSSCPTQTLAIILPRTSGQPLRIAVDEITIDPETSVQ